MPGAAAWKRSTWCLSQGCSGPIPTLSNGQIELAVKSHNNSFFDLGGDYYAVSFYVDSALDFTMNLAQLELVLADGQRKIPQGFILRKSTTLDPRRCMEEDYFSRGNIDRYPGYRKVTSEEYKVIPQYCYDLIFGVAPPKPAEKFYFNLRGFALQGRPYNIPVIEFH